ncbi:methyl-accepting chemotaxis protein [Halopelagius longus]|uniref:HAMP domain-containing protein n=1 Tax=Halopelagius longus TaxID=1236180 RepID=A0A1H1DLV8_9EURY|nr:methyl-accepting chemotaxis protein [Halopelagius longus]RDI71388.1 HAMP domain-containing protein [Halopelagius longus]SDQ77521.1 methyl-accepting chemotaxis protein [Halopelagius longus]
MSDGSRGVVSRLLGTFERLLPNVIRRRYAAKFGLVLLVIVVLIAAAGTFIHLDTKASVEQQTESQIRGVADTEARAVAEWVSKKRSTASLLAGSLSERGANTTDAENERWLEQKLIEMPSDVRAIHYVNADTGNVAASTTDSLGGTGLSGHDAPWASDAGSFLETTDTTVTSPYSLDGEPVVAFVAPVSGQDGFVVLTASLRERSYQFKSPIATGDTKVVDAEGTILMDSRNQNLLDAYEPLGGGNVTAIESGLHGNAGYHVVGARTGMESGEYAMAYSPVVGTDWVLTYHVPKERAFALQSQVTTNLELLVGLALAALLLVGATLGRGTAKSLSTIAASADAIAGGDLDVDVPETHRIDEMGRLYDSFDSMSDYLDTVAGQTEALAEKDFDDPVLDEEVPGTFGESLSRTQTELEGLITELERKAEEFGDVMASAAEGDLTRRMAVDGDNESMNGVARSFNEMMVELEATIAEVSQFAETVAAASEEVTASAQEIERASQEVSESTQLMAEGADEQQQHLEQTATETSNLSATIEEVASSASELSETAENTEAASDEGREAAETALDTMSEIERQTVETVEHIEDLEDDMSRIGDIVELISSIAEQTNILALNANIEAARAGEAGEGFAVVAEEVKSLAEETQESAQEIEETIDTVQEKSADALEEVHGAREAVDEGVEAVEHAHSSLDDIVTNVEETTEGVAEISRTTDEQAASTEEVASMMDRVTDLSNEAADRAQNVAAAAEEQSSSLSEVSDGTEELASQSERLMSLVAQFTVGSDAATGAAAGDDGSPSPTPPDADRTPTVTDGGE